LNSIYWVLIGIVIAAVTTALVLHYSLRGQQPANLMNTVYGATSLDELKTETLQEQSSPVILLYKKGFT
jgi:hypothetical protein